MEDNKFRGRYRIPSARAQWHNYDGGEYFVTICTRDREHYFGEIAGGKMHLSEMGWLLTNVCGISIIIFRMLTFRRM